MILAFAMQKGGVGKTTTTLAVGSELANLGKRVLLVDTDPQSNLTQAIGYDPTQLARSIHDVLLNPTHGPEAAVLHTEHGVDLVPTTLALAGAELTLASVFGRSAQPTTTALDVLREVAATLADLVGRASTLPAGEETERALAQAERSLAAIRRRLRNS